MQFSLRTSREDLDDVGSITSERSWRKWKYERLRNVLRSDSGELIWKECEESDLVELQALFQLLPG